MIFKRKYNIKLKLKAKFFWVVQGFEPGPNDFNASSLPTDTVI